MMKRIVVCTIMVAILGGCLIFLLCSFGGSPANTFAYVKGKLVTVVFSTGQGSGFIVKEGDKKYMITNEHVIRSGNGEEPRVMMLNGNVLKLNNCEISRDRDLIRFEVETDSDALILSDSIPEIGDDVTIYGNSDGGGVSTQISGNVLGVGGDRLEVSAQFVNGNSGSPVIDRHGLVVGIATYLTNYTNANDWVKKDTRFNGVRRFATRLVEMPWIPVSWDEYTRQIKELNDFEYFMKSLQPYLVAHYYDVPDEFLSYSDANRLKYNSPVNGLHDKMMAICQSYRKLVLSRKEWGRVSKGDLTEYLKGRKTDEQIAILRKYDTIALDKLATVVEREFEFNQCLRDALSAGQMMLKKSRITIPLLKNGIDDVCGVDSYYKTIDRFLAALNERVPSCSNVMDFASKLIYAENGNDREFGWILLYHIARNGNRDAIKRIVEYCENENQFNTKLFGEYLNDERVQIWLTASFKEGEKKLGYALGRVSYQKMQYKDAEMYWTEAARAGVVDAWLRLGEFHRLKQENGGGPDSMRSMAVAREAFKNAYELGAGKKIQRQAALYYGHLLVRFPTKKEDMIKGSEIFSSLILEDPKNVNLYEMKGWATYVLEHGRYNGQWKEYIKKAAELGSEWARNCLSNPNELFQLYCTAMRQMKLRRGGLGVKFDRYDRGQIVWISDLSALRNLGISRSDLLYIKLSAIDEQGNGNWIDVKRLSEEELVSICRGDVGSEVTLQLYIESAVVWKKSRDMTIRIKRCSVEGKQHGSVEFNSSWDKERTDAN